jgi:O-antigen/teichoic acid export membrane protein
MNLLSTTLFTGIATAVRMMSSLLVNKLIAHMVGPSGIAVLGNFYNVLSVSGTLSNAGVLSGVTKYIAEDPEDVQKKRKYIGGALLFTVFSTAIISIIMIFFRVPIAQLVFHDKSYSKVFLFLGITFIFGSLHGLVLAVVNGLREVRLLVFLNILSSFSSLILTVGMTYYFGIKGALYSISILQIVIFIASVIIIKKRGFTTLISLKNLKEKDTYTNLLQFTAMAVATMATVPITQIIVRTIITHHSSSIDAGYWESMNKVSNLCLVVVSSALSAYFLPKLSEIKSFDEFKKELAMGYKLVIPAILIMFVSMYFFRDLIINVLYTSKFTQMRSLFAWQFIGDFFRICSMLIGYIMLAKCLTKLFIMIELMGGVIYIVFSVFLVPKMGVLGAVVGYDVLYILETIYMIILYKTYFKSVFNEANEVTVVKALEM